MDRFSLRRATSADVPAIAELFRRVAGATRPYRPDLHTPDEDRAFYAAAVSEKDVWVAEAAGRIAGFINLGDGFVNHLFVDLGHQDHGIGTALLNLAKERMPELQLWVFQENLRARRFYERHGFRLVRETDGDNEEGEPDALLAWRR